jgi:chemosensory pili system protein ChpB (putative protein-glutamate methylesterase)
MADAGIRVALLAKAGESRKQLRTALQDLGADLVCEGDPSELSPEAVHQQNPKVMVVSLEPAIEAALDKFEDMLSSTSIEVVYDDAEVSGQLSGWDLNRWARHLAAKIIGTDLMPPIPAGSAMASHDEWQPQPGAPETPAEAMADAKLEDYLSETSTLAIEVPVNESYSDALTREVPAQEPVAEPEPEMSLDVNLDDLEQAMRLDSAGVPKNDLPETKVELENKVPLASQNELVEFDGFITEAADTVNAGDDFMVNAEAASANDDFISLEDEQDVFGGSVDEQDVFGAPASAHNEQEIFGAASEEAFIDFDATQADIKSEISLGDESAFNLDLSALENNTVAEVTHTSTLEFEDSASTLADFEVSEQPVAFSKYQSDYAPEMDANMDDDVAALAAQLDEFEKNDSRVAAQDPDFGAFESKDAAKLLQDSIDATKNKATVIAKEAAPVMPKFDAASLSLVDLDAEIPVEKAAVVAATSALLKKSKFSLEAIEGEEPGEKPLSDVGAILILAGMGGPDAVRQLLKALPETLNVPVLLYQHLEVGKHDRLVAQLQKVSNLPVYLAVQGQTAEAGQVAVLSVGIGVDLVNDELFFGGADTQQELVATLPAKHSVVFVLSGAAYETAAEAAYVQSQGGLALAQDPSNCFEPAAAEALVKLGGKTADIPALASMVVEYFKR